VAGHKGFDLDLADGEFAEGKLAILLREAGQYIEVKAERRAVSTGNVYVEFEYRGEPSGIATTWSTWWAVEVAPDIWVIMLTDRLKELCREQVRYCHSRGWEPYKKGGDDKASRGVALPMFKLLP
jgi:hypothetical protein